MHKRLQIILSLMIVALFLMSGCSLSASESVTYALDTGDEVEVTVDTKTGYTLSYEDNMFYIGRAQRATAETEPEDPIISAAFVTLDDYMAYIDVIRTLGAYDLTTICGYEGVHYTVEGEAGIENDYLAMLNGSIGVIAGSLAGRDLAEDALSALTIAVVSSDTDADVPDSAIQALYDMVSDSRTTEEVAATDDDALRAEPNKEEAAPVQPVAGETEMLIVDLDIVGRYYVIAYNSEEVTADSPAYGAYLDLYIDGTADVYLGDGFGPSLIELKMESDDRANSGDLTDGARLYPYTVSPDKSTVAVNIDWDNSYVFQR